MKDTVEQTFYNKGTDPFMLEPFQNTNTNNTNTMEQEFYSFSPQQEKVEKEGNEDGKDGE